MVSVSLRQNGGGTPERNPLAPGEDETVYGPIHFSPGKTPADWVETRSREAGWDQWPHRENPGLIADPDGYFDWAGRLLFLPDGSPNPDVSGTYRYQTRPDLCDPNAPDSEPVSPRYEPMWLRHKPGDTWMIGGKPFDPDDPGPYGNPRWRPDRRTGRHRRGEQPDPIPPWDWREGDPPSPDFARTRVKWDAHGDWTPERIAASGRPEDGAGSIPEHPDYRDSPAYIDPRSWQVDQAATGELPLRGMHSQNRDRIAEHACAQAGDRNDDSKGRGAAPSSRSDGSRAGGFGSAASEADADGHAGYIRPSWLRVGNEASGREAPSAATRTGEDRAEEPPDADDSGSSRGWSRREPQGRSSSGTEPKGRSGPGGDPERDRPSPSAPREERTRFWTAADSGDAAMSQHRGTDREADTGQVAADGGYRFSSIREQAFDLFMTESAILHAAHLVPERPYLRERVVWVLRWALWIALCGRTAKPEPLDSAAVDVAPPGNGSLRIPSQPAPVPDAPQSFPACNSSLPERSTHEAVPTPERLPVREPAKGHAPAPGLAAPYRPGAAASRYFDGVGRARALRAGSSGAEIAARIRAVPGDPGRRPATVRTAPYAAQWERAWDAMQPVAAYGGAA
ncbi:MAG TPA: hypothetical protein VHG10_05965 [Glycomyces sp.]|nr:hypothetical protein [Glycomyces sp.]